MKRIAIIAAMPGELKPFLDSQAKEGWVLERHGNVRLWRLVWPLGQGEWIAACAGAGQAAATRAFAEIEKSCPIDAVVSTGWAGALNEDFATGRAYRLAGVVDAQTGERFAARELESPAKSEEVLSHPGDKNKDVARVGHPGFWLVTSPKVADGPEKQRLAATYKADLVDMEAAAIARLAQMRGIPFYCIKGVSDGFREKLPDFNRFIAPDGRFKIVKFVSFALFRPWYWPALIRMGENGNKAAQGIAASLLEFLDERDYIRKRNGYPTLKR